MTGPGISITYQDNYSCIKNVEVDAYMRIEGSIHG
jgi:hypothetical protein